MPYDNAEASIEETRQTPPPKRQPTHSAGTNFPSFTCTMTKESTSRPL